MDTYSKVDGGCVGKTIRLPCSTALVIWPILIYYTIISNDVPNNRLSRYISTSIIFINFSLMGKTK